MSNGERFFVLLAVCACIKAEAGETVTYYYTDVSGTPLVTTAADGTVTSTSDSRPYGAPLLSTPVGVPGFAGQVYDAESDLVYMQARYYSPTLGRFMSVDPVRPKPGRIVTFADYAYAGNDPIGHFDPDGEYSCDTKNDEKECAEVKKALDNVRKAKGAYSSHSAQGKALNAVVAFYGTENDGNMVSVTFGSVGKGANAETDYSVNAGTNVMFDVKAAANSFGDLNSTGALEFAATVAHEGQHGVDAAEHMRNPQGYGERYNTELHAFITQSYVNEAFRTTSVYRVWDVNWPTLGREGFRTDNAEKLADCAAAGKSPCSVPH